MAFHVGQLVAAVADYPPSNLKTGHIYTVTALVMVGGVAGVTVAEAHPSGPHLGYVNDWFRPLTEQRLAVFRKLLAPSPKKGVKA